jgi:hypothetical protein
MQRSLNCYHEHHSGTMEEVEKLYHAAADQARKRESRCFETRVPKFARSFTGYWHRKSQASWTGRPGRLKRRRWQHRPPSAPGRDLGPNSEAVKKPAAAVPVRATASCSPGAPRPGFGEPGHERVVQRDGQHRRPGRDVEPSTDISRQRKQQSFNSRGRADRFRLHRWQPHP